jgi:2-amino-4-hydroxy-6-hydroxymethyldihydropteridine diphosphokinase
MTVAYVGVGSNVDPEFNVLEALRRLAARVRVTGVSTFYRTAPLGAPGSPAFVNGVWRAETELGPRELKLGALRVVEDELGRRRSGDRNAPRTIDLDLLVHGDEVVREPGLEVPDPELLVRPFAAWPLWELAPELVVPGSGRRLADAVQELARGGMEPLPELTRRLRVEVEHES